MQIQSVVFFSHVDNTPQSPIKPCDPIVEPNRGSETNQWPVGGSTANGPGLERGKEGCSPQVLEKCVIFRAKRWWFGQKYSGQNILKGCQGQVCKLLTDSLNWQNRVTVKWHNDQGLLFWKKIYRLNKYHGNPRDGCYLRELSNDKRTKADEGQDSFGGGSEKSGFEWLHIKLVQFSWIFRIRKNQLFSLSKVSDFTRLSIKENQEPLMGTETVSACHF